MEEVQNDFSSIPDQYLEKILGYLPVSALLNAEKVCSRWQNVCKNVWKSKRALRFIDRFDYEEYEIALFRCGEFITSLHVKRNYHSEQPCRRSECELDSFNIITAIGIHCKNLEHLSLYNLCDVDLDTFKLLSKCASSKLLSFHFKCNMALDYGHVRIIIGILKKSINLKQFSIGGQVELGFGDLIREIPKKCEYLDISNCFARMESVNALKSLANLETLKVSGKREMRPLISQFPAIFPNLKELDLSGIYDGTDSDLNQLLNLQNLRSFKVNSWKNVTSSHVIAFAETFQNQLELFHCAGSEWVTNTAFYRMLELCPQLRSLNVRNCKRITSAILVEASRALRERKNKIPLKIKTSLKHGDFPESRKKMLKTETHPRLIVKYD